MANSIWVNLDSGSGGFPFTGQMVGPAADNTAAPPFSFSGDLTSGYASSATGVLDIVSGGTSRARVTTANLVLPSGNGLAWGSAALATPDTFLSRLGIASAGLGTALAGITGALSLQLLTQGKLLVGVTSTDGIVLQNLSPAALATQQWSPRLRFRGNGWGTGAGATQTLDGVMELQTVQGSNPSFDLVYKTSLNGAAYVNQFDMITSSTGVPSLFMGSGGSVQAGGTGLLGWNSRASMTSPADSQWNLTKNDASAGVGLDVSTDAVMKVRVRAQNAYATIDCLGIKSSGGAPPSFGPGLPTSITVVNGIVTAIS